MKRWLRRSRLGVIGLGLIVILLAVGDTLNWLDASRAVTLPSPNSSPALPTIEVPVSLTPGASEPSTLPNPPLPIPPQPPPASTAPPAPIVGEYRDPAGRFRVGLLQNCMASPLAGSVLIESADGNLAYTVVAQSQPAGAPIGFGSGLNTVALSQVATLVFQRGEGFQPGEAQPEAGGGIVINWTGMLTIAGNTQPVSGVILVRPSPSQILLALVMTTKVGSERLPAAVSAIANTLKPI